MLDDAFLCSSFGACSSLGTFTVTWKGLLSLEYISSILLTVNFWKLVNSGKLFSNLSKRKAYFIYTSLVVLQMYVIWTEHPIWNTKITCRHNELKKINKP